MILFFQGVAINHQPVHLDDTLFDAGYSPSNEIGRPVRSPLAHHLCPCVQAEWSRKICFESLVRFIWSNCNDLFPPVGHLKLWLNVIVVYSQFVPEYCALKNIDRHLKSSSHTVWSLIICHLFLNVSPWFPYNWQEVKFLKSPIVMMWWTCRLTALHARLQGTTWWQPCRSSLKYG